MRPFIGVRLLALTVLLFVPAALISCSSPAATTSSTSSVPAGSSDRVEVTYFYESDACFCLKLASEWIHTIVEQDYKTYLDSGKLVFHSYDTRDPGSKAVMEQFNSPAYALFITTVKGAVRDTREVKSIWFYTDSSGTNEMLKSKFWGVVKTELDKALGAN